MMFDLEHHQKILTILNALDADFCRDVSAYFGGGTLLALQYGEYRWSKDIDFICPLGAGYRKLRTDMAEKGYAALFKDQSGIGLPREFKADQYGVRFAVVVGDTLIKFEMVAEARIALDAPVYPEWCALPCLGFADSCSEKLLSNADRWADAGVRSRDLIDLAVLRLQAEIPALAIDKAENAYPVKLPLFKALTRFQSNPDYRRQCFTALQVKSSAQIMDGIDLLAADYALPPSVRTLSESIA
ncbi:MAG: nucleotidyl transferase AbiEii/AbiGii toxin family protein [Candidatus Thiothrix putei]|uniref:Nucleotidyl transferase AbiEii/AbiGii toxin family protein n=1 Tax=Candidatus Thiothrix putei TaxID=3080811 RepID=A0AA95HI83_9GAMM|nr:MAG: nucleotidyl transferase AbiEii/AbiGii toxin family protein [Candidatus Thiothrix putei]